MEREEEVRAGRIIALVARKLHRQREYDLKELGITPSQADALHFFSQHQGTSIADLRRTMKVSHQTASGIVHRMEALRLLEKDNDRFDSRSLSIRPTEKGLELESKVNALREQTGNTLFAGMSAADQRAFLRLLKSAATSLGIDVKEP